MRNLFEFICGNGCENKRVIPLLFNRICQSKTLMDALHDGCYDGDGSKTIKDRYSFTTTSRELFYQMFFIKTVNGSICSMWNKKPKNKKRFYTLVANMSKRHHHYIDAGNFSILTIQSKKEIPYKGYVYDIEVENEHSFYTEFGEVHNCKFNNPSVLNIEFANTWNYISKNWELQEIVNVFEAALLNYVSPNLSKTCIFFDKENKLCRQHDTRGQSCRTYGITPEKEYKDKQLRLKILYQDRIDGVFKDQCNLVKTADGSVVTEKDTGKWWNDLVKLEASTGVGKDKINDGAEGTYRTYHDHMLIHLLSEKTLQELTVIRMYGSMQDRLIAVKQTVEAVKKRIESGIEKIHARKSGVKQ